MDSVPGVEKPKGFSVKRRLAEVRQLQIDVSRTFIGKMITPAVVDLMVEKAVPALKLPHRAAAPMEQLLLRYLDQELKPLLARRLMLKLRACREYFREGEVPPVWYGEPPLWACSRILSLERIRYRKEWMTELVMVPLSGLLAGDLFRLPVRRRHLNWIMRTAGLPRFEQLCDQDAIGLILHIRYGRNRFRHIYMLEVEATSSQQKKNRSNFRKD